MESDKVEGLLKKYFQGATTLAQEKELRDYFSSQDIASHLQQYASLFDCFAVAKEQQNMNKTPVFEVVMAKNKNKKGNLGWVSIAASVVVLMGIATYVLFDLDATKENTNLGTYEDPEAAFRATQKELSLLSKNVNIGIKSVQYIEEYQTVKNRVFVSAKKEWKRS
ncbi:hypothetical protein [Flavobacterium sp. LS1R10]|uniref:hypothetical protein n=1 Tax=Flavobacterium sp. LS1R10 TaxID=2497482 RepID=UPI000F82F57C|nr:hypothetical protein [Flavobacterium sp. LS1R10]RTY74770.1 hypothetical protein EKL96_08455 [Flavobacterium sp. LS1R10]